jgi:hypothetical protein
VLFGFISSPFCHSGIRCSYRETTSSDGPRSDSLKHLLTPLAVKENSSTPAGTEPWDEAFLRVESYLHAHHIESRVLLNRLATEVIEEARCSASDRPGVPPVKLAMETVHRRMAHWFRTVFTEGNWKEERFRARGRLALVMTDTPSKSPQAFLSNEPVAPEFAAQMQQSTLQPGPEVRLSNMAPAKLEFAFGDNDEKEKAPGLGRWAAYPALAVSVLIVSAMAYAWTSTH